MRLSIAAAKGTRSSFLVIPSTSPSPYRPSFLLRSLSHTLRLLSLNNGEPLPPSPPPPPPLFSLSSLCTSFCLLGRGALSHVEVHSARSCNVVLARLVGERRSANWRVQRVSASLQTNLSGIVGRVGPAVPLKRMREDRMGKHLFM